MLDGAVVGVVGCGNWGSKRVRALSSFPEIGQVVAIDTDHSRAETAASSFPKTRAFKDLASALPHVSALVIATPPPTHYELAVTALRHGKHVLVEKPLTESIHEAVLLIEQAHRSSCVLMTGHTLLFNPAVRELRHRLSRGSLGRIQSIHAAQFSRGHSVHGADAMWDLAPHSISVFNHLIGSLPTLATAWNKADCKPTEEIRVELQYGKAGPSGFIHIACGSAERARMFTVIGSKKLAVYDDLAGSQLKMYRRSSMRTFENVLEYNDYVIVPKIAPAEPLVEELRHFLGAIRDQSVPEISGTDGMITVAIMEAIDRSRRGNMKPTTVFYPPVLSCGDRGIVSDERL